MKCLPFVFVALLLTAPALAGSITDTINDVGGTCRVIKEHINTAASALILYHNQSRALQDLTEKTLKEQGLSEVIPPFVDGGSQGTYALLANITTSYKNLGCDKY